MQLALRVNNRLKIPDGVLVQPLIVSPTALLQDVVGQMHHTRCRTSSSEAANPSIECNCVLIVDGKHPLGMFTERDLVQLIATGRPIAQMAVAGVMSPLEIVQPVQLAENVTLSELGQLMKRHRTQHLPVLNESDQILGVVTSESLCHCLQVDQALKPHHESVQASDAWLKVALEAAQVGVWDLDWRTGQQTWSAETLTLFAYPPSTEASPAMFWQRVHPEDRDLVKHAYQEAKQTGAYHVTYRLLLPDQTVRWLSSTGRVFFDQAGHPIRMVGTNIDISQQKLSQQKQCESELRTILREKEVLLEEVHHRMKNNLQIISSMVRMQARRSADPQVVELLQEVQNRVQSMALIHEQLCQSSNPIQLDFAAYLHPLMELLLSVYGVSAERVGFSVQTQPQTQQKLYLSFKQAIFCGLIVNELVSNALKHAFPDHQRGEISISLISQQFGTNTTITLSVRDNGVSLPPTINWQAPSSLGLKIIHSLVAQLKGVIQIDCTQGTAFHITFPYLPHP